MRVTVAMHAAIIYFNTSYRIAGTNDIRENMKSYKIVGYNYEALPVSSTDSLYELIK